MIEPDLVRLSPNINQVPMPDVHTVIIHCTRSGVAGNESEFEGTLNYMATPGTTSSHWVIGREPNQKARVVYDWEQAWHAGPDNERAWGIEIEQGSEQDGFTQVQLDQLVAVCKGYMIDFEVPPVHCSSSSQPGFIGHQETQQGKSYGKSDPGSLFDWTWFMAQLQGTAVGGRTFAYGNEQNGLELVGNTQQVTWVGGVAVASVGDPEGVGLGRKAKLFGAKWRWLRSSFYIWPGISIAFWSDAEGD